MDRVRGGTTGQKRSGLFLPTLVLLPYLGAALLARPQEKNRPAPEPGVKVSVLVILASDQHKDVDKRLQCVAREVQKLHPHLTGFRPARSNCKSIPVKGTESFDLVEGQELQVTVLKKCKEGKVQLKLKPPTLGEITYTTCLNKFFPFCTSYQTKNREILIIAVQVQSCEKPKQRR